MTDSKLTHYHAGVTRFLPNAAHLQAKPGKHTGWPLERDAQSTRSGLHNEQYEEGDQLINGIERRASMQTEASWSKSCLVYQYIFQNWQKKFIAYCKHDIVTGHF